MTSRSCSAALRSFYAACLLCLSCLSSQQDSLDHREHDLPKTRVEHDDEGGEDAIAEDALPAEGGSGAEEPHPQVLEHDPPAHPCPTGQMRFEDRCQPKERVNQVVEERETKALLDVHNAKMPGEKIEATRELIEQQVAQVEKAEDDLDEIIEQLERKNAEADLKNKLAGVDEGKIERRPP